MRGRIEARATASTGTPAVMATGHGIRLIPTAYVNPYEKRQKMGWLPPSPDGIGMCRGRNTCGRLSAAEKRCC